MDLWIDYLLRFSHLVAGISWIGSSFYFIWLDGAFQPTETPRRNVDGEVFMVHGGFYYQVEKRKIYPGELPKTLHWFKWEATLTWVTGIMLFVFVYWLKGASLLVDPSVMALSQGQAIGLSLAIIVLGWFFYDTLWHPRLAQYQVVSAVVSLISFAGLVFGLTRVFSGRGAFMVTGVILGTQMLLNVWVRILPGQAKMLADAQAGRVPDYSLSLKSKTRSVHNTYFIFPVLFIMLSNHYPGIYNHSLNWLLLILLAVAGAMTRHAMVSRTPEGRWTLIPAAVSLAAVFFLSTQPARLMEAGLARVEYGQVSHVIQARCVSCHSSRPTDSIFREAPKGLKLETEAQVRAVAGAIYTQVVASRVMPLANRTGMLERERALIGQWLKQESLVP